MVESDQRERCARLWCGTARSGRAARIDALMRERWGHARLIVPTRRHAARRAEDLLLAHDAPGLWDAAVLAFDEFAQRLLERNGVFPIRIGDLERRLLFQRAIEGLRLGERGDAFAAVAGTTGFASHLLRVITQLKQAAIEPAEFRRRLGSERLQGAFDGLVAEVYEAYQGTLLEEGVYDLPGLFWEAALRCRDEQPAFLEGVDTLLLDGFDDFTPSEFRLIETISERVDTVAFGLDYMPDPERAPAFWLTARTVDTIRARWGVLPATYEEAEPTSFTEYAASRFGWGETPTDGAGLRPDLEILPCADMVQEFETIARRVKSLLAGGVAAEEVAVVFRSLRDSAALLRSVFAEFSVPLRLVQRPSLWDSAVGAFVLRLVEAITVWERDTVCDALASPWITWGDDVPAGHTASFGLLARSAMIISGREEWPARLAALARRIDSGRGEDMQRLLDRLPDAAGILRSLMARVGQLGALADLLPERASPAEFAGAVQRVLESAGIERAVQAYPVAAIRAGEARALDALRHVLGRWRLWAGRNAEAQPRPVLVAFLRQALRDTTFDEAAAGPAVSGLDLEALRLLRYDYVFLGGANEGALPRPPSVSAVYSENDLGELAKAGVAIESKRDHCEREAALFRHALEAPRKGLCITWHRLSREGKEQFPSPYVQDVLALFPADAIQRPSPPPDAFVPPPAEAASPRDLRNIAFLRIPAWREQLGDRADIALPGADIERARHDSGPFDCHDGVLALPAAIEAVAQRFDEHHQFSVHQIETYRACPFRFFVDRVLGIDETDVPTAEFDPRLRGLLLHAALERFHKRYLGTPASAIDLEEGLDAMRGIVADVFDELAWRSHATPPGVERAERGRLALLLERYFRIAHEADDSWAPSHFEVSFGKSREAAEDGLSRVQPFALDTEAGRVLFSGRIDRIDLDGAEARIVDYKSSIRIKAGDFKAGLSIQLALYALALEECLMPGTTCAEGRFLQIGATKTLEALAREGKKAEWPEREKAAREAVAAAVTGIREGRFPPVPARDETCQYCAARRACRHEQGRVERKEVTP